MHGDRGDLELPVVESSTGNGQPKARSHNSGSFEDDKQRAEEARRLMLEDVERPGREGAAVMVRSAPRRYKNFKTRTRLLHIEKILKDLQGSQEKDELANCDILGKTGQLGVDDAEQVVPLALMKEKEGPSYLRFEAWVEGKRHGCPTASV